MTLSGKGILRLLVAAFLIYYIWRDPSGAGAAIGNFLQGAGNIIEEVFTRFADFLQSLGIGDDSPAPITPTTAGLSAALAVIVRIVRMLPFLESPQSIMEQYLIGDEKVYFVDRPAPVTLLNKWMLLAVAFAVFVTVRIGSPRAVAFGFFVIVAVAAWLGVKSIRYRYTRYIITSLRVMRMTGVFDRKYYWIPWQRVTDLAFEQTIVGRIFGFATLSIESANEFSGLKQMSDLNDPWKFQDLVTQLVGRRQRYLNPDLSPEASAAAAEAFDEAVWME